MNAETFFKKLDEIRSQARQKFGMKQEPITFLSEPVQNLITLVDELHDETVNKAVAPTAPPPPSPPSIDHLAGLEPVDQQQIIPPLPTSNEELMANPVLAPITMTKVPRDPVPVHPVEVVEATKDTVVAPDGGWQDGDS